VIDLDPLWRLVIVLAACGVIPLLLLGAALVRGVQNSISVVLLRSWCRGHLRRRGRLRGRHHRRGPCP
jgi:hypothetical protein